MVAPTPRRPPHELQDEGPLSARKAGSPSGLGGLRVEVEDIGDDAVSRPTAGEKTKISVVRRSFFAFFSVFFVFHFFVLSFSGWETGRTFGRDGGGWWHLVGGGGGWHNDQQSLSAKHKCISHTRARSGSGGVLLSKLSSAGSKWVRLQKAILKSSVSPRTNLGTTLVLRRQATYSSTGFHRAHGAR